MTERPFKSTTHTINPCFCYSLQRPEGGAVLGEALLRPPEAEGDISSQTEHCCSSGGGAVSVPTGPSAAGAHKIPQRQRFVWDLRLHW